MVLDRFFKRTESRTDSSTGVESEHRARHPTNEGSNDSDVLELPSSPESISATPDMVSNPEDIDVNINMTLVHKSLTLLLDNKFVEAEEILKRHYETDMHFALGYGAMLTFQAIMTLDKKEIEKGYSILARGVELTDSRRQKKTDYLRMRPPTYAEVVAELLYAETLLLDSLLTFAQSDSVISMIKGAVKGRSSYGIYKDLYNKYIVKTEKIEASGSKKAAPIEVSKDFLSGILLGYGCFQIALAMVPPKLLKLLELVGLQGDTNTGLDALAKGVELDGLRSPFCAHAIATYNTAFKFNLDPYNIDLTVVDELSEKYLSRHPECVSFHFFRGRAAVLRRDLTTAKDIFEKCVQLQNEWITMHHTCWFELMWIAAMQQKWSEAADYAERLFGASNWSKTSYLYLLASFRYAQFVDSDQNRKYANDPNITNLFRDVKEYQIRIAGKRLQVEKYCVRKARSYQSQNNFLFYPAIEAMFVWGMFVLLDKQMANTLISQCQDRLELITDHQLTPDDMGLGHLMVGSLWKHCYLLESTEVQEEREQYLERSEESLRKSLSFEKHIKKDHFVIAWSNYELAELFWLKKDAKQAHERLKACRKVSSKVKYSLESRIMFKVHNLQERVKELESS